MKKYVLTLIVTLMVGVGGYGFYTAQNRQAALSSQAQLLLDNVEALADYELPEVVVNCSYRCNDGRGQCWKRSTNLLDCEWSGNSNDYCQCPS
ncbi:hypothetical protein B5F34_11600 [Mediterranea sp. An20]|nr:hypothetical protein B5F34_11600 [Mediterranea sp. An20]